MLLRSSSTPLLRDLEAAAAATTTTVSNLIPRTRSVSFALCSMSTTDKVKRAFSETNLKEISSPVAARMTSPVQSADDGDAFWTTSLNRSFGLMEEEGCGAGGDGGGGRLTCGRGRGGGESDGDDGDEKGTARNSEAEHATDSYYRSMIEANPGNSLLLSNYAKYLKEVRGDLVKAEEYCGRALLANPNDGDMLSLYADLVWKNQKDAPRAEIYFDQAVKAAPDDCYVAASYAKFLWDAEDEEEEDQEEKVLNSNSMLSTNSAPSAASASMWQGFQAQRHIAAAS